MPAGVDEPDALVDTSVAVALVVSDHERHASTVRGVGGRTLGLSGHAAFETFSVLTRLPPPLRRSPRAVHDLLEADFPFTHFLSSAGATEFWARVADLNISGGAVYDGLVASAAHERGVRLLSLDARASVTYRLLGVQVEFLG